MEDFEYLIIFSLIGITLMIIVIPYMNQEKYIITKTPIMHNANYLTKNTLQDTTKSNIPNCWITGTCTWQKKDNFKWTAQLDCKTGLKKKSNLKSCNGSDCEETGQNPGTIHQGTAEGNGQDFNLNITLTNQTLGNYSGLIACNYP